MDILYYFCKYSAFSKTVPNNEVIFLKIYNDQEYVQQEVLKAKWHAGRLTLMAHRVWAGLQSFFLAMLKQVNLAQEFLIPAKIII